MFLFSKPTESQVREALARQRAAPFSYREVGASRDGYPSGYQPLRGRIELGQRSAAFDRAVEALRRWKMFDLSWMQLCWPDAEIETGADVAVVIRHLGLWSLNVSRIVYVIDETGPVRRFGFAYGTLPEHAEQGEERFLIEWDQASSVVSYDISSFSRPRSPLARLGLPIARSLQRRFIRDSLTAMARATQST